MGGQRKLSKSTTILVALIIVLAMIIAGFVSCGYGGVGGGEDRIRVMVSILPQLEFVEAVGGDRVAVTVMVPPGQEPHTYEPTPGQMSELEGAAIYFKVGSGIDFELTWMNRFTELNDEMLIVDGSEGIELIPVSDSGEGAMDPHIWLSPSNAKIMVQNLLEGLMEIDPQNASEYQDNSNRYIRQLNDLDSDIYEVLLPLENRKILTYHPAWGYFAASYDLEQLPIEEGGREPTIKGLMDLIDQAREYDIKVIFASPQFSQRSAEQIASEIDGSVVLVDPLAENYISNLQHVADEISIGSE